ncbi:hypothetical protein [Streptomyces sp. NPDC003077]|uniref:hypothetical protein n=1 Tax=Streptomyces sp. NPDC003077 TaxID=3154443 RepID=UPI0033BB1670
MPALAVLVPLVMFALLIALGRYEDLMLPPGRRVADKALGAIPARRSRHRRSRLGGAALTAVGARSACAHRPGYGGEARPAGRPRHAMGEPPDAALTVVRRLSKTSPGPPAPAAHHPAHRQGGRQGIADAISDAISDDISDGNNDTPGR